MAFLGNGFKEILVAESCFVLDHIILLCVISTNKVVTNSVVEVKVMFAAFDNLQLAEGDGVQVARKKV